MTHVHQLVGHHRFDFVARQRLEQALGGAARVVYPPDALCTDNGAMIAYAGLQRLKAGQTEDLGVKGMPRWSLDSLPPL